MNVLIRKVVMVVGAALAVGVASGAQANCWVDGWGNAICQPTPIVITPMPVMRPAPPVCRQVPVRDPWGYIVGSRPVCE